MLFLVCALYNKINNTIFFLGSLLISPIIGIGDNFNGGSFDPTSYSTCATGAEVNFMYDVIILRCTSPMLGRYVTIYMTGPAKTLQLCNVRVFTTIGMFHMS